MSNDLSPITELNALAEVEPKYHFKATSKEDAAIWQRQFRQELSQIVGFIDTPKVAPEPVLLEESDRGDHVRRKVMISTAKNVKMPVYLLIPKNVSQPLPVAIAYHGHGYGVKDIVGITSDGKDRDVPEGYHKDFAIELCRKGFLVAAPEISCFGEREHDYSYLAHSIPTTCHNAATYAFMLGKSALGMRVRDGMRLIDYISSLPEADSSRIGAMGISGGGMLCFHHTALDERIGACVVSGYFNTFKDSILSINHCTCNFVPGLLRLGEMTDIAGLILPRPILIEAGTHDEIFPVEATKRSVERVREMARVFGCDPTRDIVLDIFEGDHQISGRLSYDFLLERVGRP